MHDFGDNDAVGAELNAPGLLNGIYELESNDLREWDS